MEVKVQPINNSSQTTEETTRKYPIYGQKDICTICVKSDVCTKKAEFNKLQEDVMNVVNADEIKDYMLVQFKCSHFNYKFNKIEKKRGYRHVPTRGYDSYSDVKTTSPEVQPND